ncbi:MAG TPA: NAD(P)/FAD-dependent oxidoreductase [Acidimicrobiia bacterium]
MTDYDVIVVGARVAGSATAMLLARQGHSVLLVDRVAMPSDTVSTHALLRTGVLQLRRWGLLERIVELGTPAVRDIVLGFGNERIPVRFRAEHGIDALYAPRRHLLDGELNRAAVESGAELRDGTRVVDVVRDPSGRVGGVVVANGSTTTEITARIVVGADGVHSRIAELVGAEAMKSDPPANAIHYAYYSKVGYDGFWFQFTPGVNAGLIATNDDAVLAFAGRPAAGMAAFREDPDGEFLRLLRHGAADLSGLVEAGERVSPFRGTPGLPGFIRKPWGPGWALVGDAGYTKDPISAHGISDALRDAELCARAVGRGLSHPGEEAAAMAGYQALRDELSGTMFRESQALAAYRWDAAEASRRMRAISESVRRECDAIAALPPWGAAVSSAA